VFALTEAKTNNKLLLTSSYYTKEENGVR